MAGVAEIQEKFAQLSMLPDRLFSVHDADWSGDNEIVKQASICKFLASVDHTTHVSADDVVNRAFMEAKRSNLPLFITAMATLRQAQGGELNREVAKKLLGQPPWAIDPQAARAWAANLHIENAQNLLNQEPATEENVNEAMQELERAAVKAVFCPALREMVKALQGAKNIVYAWHGYSPVVSLRYN